jgi:hypothetical protein
MIEGNLATPLFLGRWLTLNPIAILLTFLLWSYLWGVAGTLLEGAVVHLEHHHVSLVVVSRAPLREIALFKKRMSWRFRWVSSFGSDFNFDYHVSLTEEKIAKSKMYYNYELRDCASEEMPGISVFYKDKTGDIFHTYSSYGRGGDLLIGTYNYLDLAPLSVGRKKRVKGWIGCGITTSMRRTVSSTRRGDTSPRKPLTHDTVGGGLLMRANRWCKWSAHRPRCLPKPVYGPRIVESTAARVRL